MQAGNQVLQIQDLQSLSADTVTRSVPTAGASAKFTGAAGVFTNDYLPGVN